MKDFLIFALIFAATATFAQSDKQVEPVKQVVESEDIKMEMKEAPPAKELDEELDKLEEAVEEELELLEKETEEKEMEDLKEEEEMKVIDEESLEKEKLKIESETDLKPDEE